MQALAFDTRAVVVAGVDIHWHEFEEPKMHVAHSSTALSSSRALVERYFDQQRTLAELAAGRAESGEERLQIVSAALQSNERIMSVFLTISQQLAFGQQTVPLAAAPPLPVPDEPVQRSLKEALRAEIAKTTGFPRESIGDGVPFVELGLDSLSIAEVWGQLLDDFPEIQAFAEHMFAIRCMQDLEQFTAVPLSKALAREIDEASGDNVFEREAALEKVLAMHPRHRQAGRELLNAPGRQELASLLEKFDKGARDPVSNRERVERFVVTWERMPLPANWTVPDRIRFVAPGNGPAAARMREFLSKQTALTGDDHAHLVFLAGPGPGIESTLDQNAGVLFSLLKSLAAGTPLTVIGYGEDEPMIAGLAGLVQSFRREVASPAARYVCLTSPLASIDEALLLRMMFAVTKEPVLREAGRWAEKRTAEWSARPSIQGQRLLDLNSESRILALGGGDGITAEMGILLAARYGCEIVAAGRTPFPESQPFDDIFDGPDAAPGIRRRFFSNGSGASQAAALTFQALRQRALWRTRQRVQEAGGRFTYFQTDVGREKEVYGLLTQVLDRGPVHGLIHGAGIARDNRVERKPLEEFLSVVRPKAVAAALLPKLLQGQPMQFAVFLSSMTSLTGTAGQTDYATGNEVLNAVAQTWNRQVDFPVKSLLWSVWTESGLASPQLKKHMDRMGLGGISNAEGLELFLRELTAGGKHEDCLLLAPRSTFRYAQNDVTAHALLAAGSGQ